MTTQKKKKSAKEKKVLIGSVVVAAAIVAGSTFAWFSSKDEVTNRLTASADYNVSIVEDFQPPKEWIPGQTVNKDVAAVNTGNVDAFVRMWLDGKMRLLSETTPTIDVTNANLGANLKNLSKVTDVERTKLGLNYSKTEGSTVTYYKTLSTTKINNPQDINNANPESSDIMGTADNQQAGFSEVQSMQAAGVLVYAPANAKYTWNLEQATDMWTKDGNNAPKLQNLAKGTTVGSVGSGAAYEITPNQTDNTGNYYGAIDASTFKPETTGLYLFRRNIDDTDDGTANKYEYSGYYYVSDLDGGTYFALHTADGDNKHSDYVLPAGAVKENNTAEPSKDQVLPVAVENGKVFVYTAKEELIDNLTWEYKEAAGTSPAQFIVRKGATNDSKKIEINVALANVGTDADQWQAMKDNANNPSKGTTFYYTNDVEAGDTTRKLVDSVTLSPDTQVGAYLAFDFDLNVIMDSVQVTMTEDGKEGNATINPWAVADLTNDTAVTHNIQPATGAVTLSGSEIEKIFWS